MNLFIKLCINGFQYAKGDHEAAMNAINTQRTAQTGQQNQLSDQFKNQYKNAYSSDQDLKSTVTQGYKNYLDPDYINTLLSKGGLGDGGMEGLFKSIGGVSGGIDESLIKNMGTEAYAGYQKLAQGVSPQFRSAFDASMAQLDKGIADYQGFAKTGGFSDADVSSMRDAAAAPTRQIYAGANADLTAAQARAGGNLGNEAVARLRMAGQSADKIGDINTATESNIAQMRQQGKEFGITGESQASLAKAQAQTAVEQLDSQMKAAGLGGMTDIEKTKLSAELENARLNQGASSANASIAANKAALALNYAHIPMDALKGMTDLYGTTPADTALSASDQLNLQNLIQSGQLGLINGQINASQIPSNFETAMGHVGSVAKVAGQVAAAIGTGGASLAIPGMGLYGGSSSGPAVNMAGSTRPGINYTGSNPYGPQGMIQAY